MEYNTARNHLIIPEYGRNIQRMIEYAIGVEDREERNKLAQAIIDVMALLNPQLKDMTDFKHKLWDHLFIISNFQLDVDSPYPMPGPHTLENKPQRVNYPSNHIQFKHYGKNIEKMIQEIKGMPEGEEKDELISTIANFLKMAYLNHNRDTVSDELIFDHLELLSGGELKFKENMRLNTSTDLLTKSRKQIPEKKMMRPQSQMMKRNMNKKRP